MSLRECKVRSLNNIRENLLDVVLDDGRLF